MQSEQAEDSLTLEPIGQDPQALQMFVPIPFSIKCLPQYNPGHFVKVCTGPELKSCIHFQNRNLKPLNELYHIPLS